MPFIHFIIYVFNNENMNFSMQISAGQSSPSFFFSEVTQNYCTDDFDNDDNPDDDNFLVIF